MATRPEPLPRLGDDAALDGESVPTAVERDTGLVVPRFAGHEGDGARRDVRGVDGDEVDATAQGVRKGGEQVAAVRGAAGESTAAVTRIEQTIGEVEAIADAIASAIAQQSSATAEIARNATQASTSCGDMADRIAEVSTAATRTAPATCSDR